MPAQLNIFWYKSFLFPLSDKQSLRQYQKSEEKTQQKRNNATDVSESDHKFSYFSWIFDRNKSTTISRNSGRISNSLTDEKSHDV